jgi:hypothetical protein
MMKRLFSAVVDGVSKAFDLFTTNVFYSGGKPTLLDLQMTLSAIDDQMDLLSAKNIEFARFQQIVGSTKDILFMAVTEEVIVYSSEFSIQLCALRAEQWSAKLAGFVQKAQAVLEKIITINDMTHTVAEKRDPFIACVRDIDMLLQLSNMTKEYNERLHFLTQRKDSTAHLFTTQASKITHLSTSSVNVLSFNNVFNFVLFFTVKVLIEEIAGVKLDTGVKGMVDFFRSLCDGKSVK